MGMEAMITIARIQRTVSDRQHIGISALKGLRARHSAMYLARRLTKHSYHVIGKHFGGRDHATVIHACRKVQERVHSNQKTQVFIAEMIDRLTLKDSQISAVDKSALFLGDQSGMGA
jgi:chromosomal replication initiator protein